MGLKDVIDTVERADAPIGEPITDLSEAHWAFLRRHGDRRDPTRAAGYHPSGASRFCPRLDTLKRWFDRPEGEYIPPGLRQIFDWGSAWHWWCQNHYYGPMGVLWGRWKALCCGRESDEDEFLPPPCARCASPGLIRAWHEAREIGAGFGGFWTYIEPTLEIPEEDMIGHCDGWLKMTPWDIRVPIEMLEIKTINANGFSRLGAPYDGHSFQANVYMGVAREMADPIPNPERAHVAYWTKGDKQTAPKTFRVSFDPEPLAEWRRRIALHKRAEASGWRLTPGICRSRVDFNARNCSHVDLCFRDDIDQVVEQKIADAGGESAK